MRVITKTKAKRRTAHRNKRAHPTEIFTQLHVVTRTSVQTPCLVLTLKPTYFRRNLRKENLDFYPLTQMAESLCS